MRPSPCLTHRVSFLESRLLQYAVASVHPFEFLVSSHSPKDRGRACLGDWANGTNTQHHRVASQTSWTGGRCRVRPGFPPIARARRELRRPEARPWSISRWERPRSDLRATQKRPKSNPKATGAGYLEIIVGTVPTQRTHGATQFVLLSLGSWSNIHPAPQSSALPFRAANSPFFAVLCCAGMLLLSAAYSSMTWIPWMWLEKTAAHDSGTYYAHSDRTQAQTRA